jgi:hypothetical protein
MNVQFRWFRSLGSLYTATGQYCFNVTCYPPKSTNPIEVTYTFWYVLYIGKSQREGSFLRYDYKKCFVYYTVVPVPISCRL